MLKPISCSFLSYLCRCNSLQQNFPVYSWPVISFLAKQFQDNGAISKEKATVLPIVNRNP